jgi:hypothetical protein
MNQTLSLLGAIAIGVMMSGALFAQEGAAPSQHTTGTVVEGNTTMVFKTANKSDLHMKSLKQWTNFAQSHPQIARQLAKQPTLLSDAGYLGKHPELRQLFDDNPGLLAEMKQDPGNFNANPPPSDR